jgi:hypothetical protein
MHFKKVYEKRPDTPPDFDKLTMGGLPFSMRPSKTKM